MKPGRRRRASVLVVEDEELLRRALEVALTSEGYEVAALADGRDIERVLGQFRPDLAILDVRLPRGPDGYALASSIRRESQLPVVFLTGEDSLQARLAGFDAGGDDYVVKPFLMEELVARVEALVRRGGGPRGVWRVSDLVVDPICRTASRGGHSISLTRTEFDLLVMLLRHTGQVLSRRQLLEGVWGAEIHDPNAVEFQISVLRRKLEAHGPRLIHTVRSVGYVLRA